VEQRRGWYQSFLLPRSGRPCPRNHFFPDRKGDPKWQRAGTNIFLGIDHTAIVVSDTDKSLAFYRDLLGLRVAGESENYGVEQEHLNQVFGARLHITGLRAEHGPGIEFLEYITPPGGRNLPPDAKSNDLVFWDTHLAVNDLSTLSATLHEGGVTFVSKPGSPHSQSSETRMATRSNSTSLLLSQGYRRSGSQHAF